ncbi:lish motif-containing protein [Hysterangium stoloniferum]|nr:lish motif-containing protein [Hysterangium stoloniferum]
MNKSNVLSFAAAPGDIRRIVLDYLCTNCYADTAQVFARESCPKDLDKDGDEILMTGDNGDLEQKVLHAVQMRKEIKTHLLDGRISDAIELLNAHFPDVLSPKTIAPNYSAPTLLLNLRIQNFVEEVRTIPLPSQELFRDAKTPVQTALDRQPQQPLCPADMDRKTRLLKLMNELYVLMHDLPSSHKDYDTYRDELRRVGGLLAYPVPEKSREMRQYLARERREILADQINEAIMVRTNQNIPTTVELIARHTTVIFSTLNALGYALPSSDQRPPGLDSLLSLIKPRSLETSKESKTTPEKDSQEVIPKFELEMLM